MSPAILVLHFLAKRKQHRERNMSKREGLKKWRHAQTVRGAAGSDFRAERLEARHLLSTGVQTGSPFRVNSYTTDNQFDSSVAMNSAGDFVVAWVSRGQDGSSYGVYAQRYNAAGAPQGTEFRVNTYTPGGQRDP